MASRDPDEFAETEEETLHQKRARRVSFAETTAVHFFNRDEDSEATPDASTVDDNSSSEKLRRSESDEIMELLYSDDELDGGDVGGSSDDIVKSSFLRPMDSPSSGSCFGSATSNDEDNFFGPVSADFIRPGRSLDSGASEENHDVTMDSTAFSMHFRSLARSDSGAEFKTPTAVREQFGESFLGPASSAASVEDLMVLTGARKLVIHSSLPADKVSDSGNSDDMSLVGENPHRYDYGMLPPELDVLLAEGNKDVRLLSPTSHVECSNSRSSPRKDNPYSLDHNGHEPSNYTVITDLLMTAREASPSDCVNIDKGNEDVPVAAPDEIGDIHSKNVKEVLGRKTPVSNHIQASVVLTNAEAYMKDSAEAGGKFESPPSRVRPYLDHEPQAGSVSSLLAKRRQIFMNSGGLHNAQLNSAPFDKEFQDKRFARQALSTSIFAKSISRLKRLESFPFVSASKVEANASRLLAPGGSTKITENTNDLEYASKDIPVTRFDAPIVCLDAHFSNVAESEAQFRKTSNINNSMNTVKVNHASHAEEVSKGAEESGLHRSLSPHINSAKFIEVSSSVASPGYGFGNSKSKDNGHSQLELHAIEAPNSMRSDSSPEMMFSDLKGSKETGRTDAFIFSPGNGEQSKVSASPLYIKSPFTADMVHQGQSSIAKEKKAGGLPSMDDLSSSDINHSVGMPKERLMLKHQYDHSVNSAGSNAAVMDKVSKSHEVVSSSDAVETSKILTTLSAAFSIQSNSLRSDYSLKLLPVEVQENPKKESAGLSPKNQLYLIDDTKFLVSVGEDDAVPRKLMSRYGENGQILQNSSSNYGSDGSSSLKRNLSDRTEDHNDEILSLQRTTKLFKDQKYYESHQMVRKISESMSAVRDGADVFTSFQRVTEQLLSPLTDKFDEPLMEKLNDALVHLYKLKIFELQREFGSQRASDSACLNYSNRVMDTKSLLYKNVYQQVNLHLLQLKRDKLLDRVRQMNFKVEESEKLKSSMRSGHICSLKDVQIDCLNPESCSTGINKTLISAEISALRKEFEDSSIKITNLSKSFHSYFKDMDEITCAKTVASVKELLNRRLASQSLYSELQLCRIERLKAMHGKPSILLDHGGFFSQRFIVQSHSTDLLISKTLNNTKISKNQMFHDTDVLSAFSFVLSGETHLTYGSLTTIAQEIQKTASLFQCLLDVIQEVEQATLELRNLTWSKFFLPTDDKLELRLCFTDFNSFAKVTMSIDVSCLKQGVYPSQVLPSEVQGKAARNLDHHELLVANIQTAVRGVKCGYMRILSICRCVARMIQAHHMV